MSTFVTGDQLNLNARNIEASTRASREDAFLHIVANTNDAVSLINRHAVDVQKPASAPVSAVVEISADLTVAKTEDDSNLHSLGDIQRYVNEAYGEAA